MFVMASLGEEHSKHSILHDDRGLWFVAYYLRCKKIHKRKQSYNHGGSVSITSRQDYHVFKFPLKNIACKNEVCYL